MRKTIMSAAVLAAATVAMPANATVLLNFVQGGNVTSLGSWYDVVADFDSVTPPLSGTAGTDYVIKSNTDDNGAALPNSSPLGTNYLSVLGGHTVTIDLPANTYAFGFDWGSLDTYNWLIIDFTLELANGQTIVVPGSTFVNTPADGGQVLPLTNGLFTVTGDAGEIFKSITIGSGTNSAEIDNLVAAVPEASTWAMMLVGLGAVGFAMRRQKVAVSFA